MKVICVALLSMLCVGCSSTCKDGYGSFWGFDRGNYKACKMKCCPDTPEDDKKECRCSATCPCWRKHG